MLCKFNYHQKNHDVLSSTRSRPKYITMCVPDGERGVQRRLDEMSVFRDKPGPIGLTATRILTWQINMTTLWHGKSFCITGPLWGESTICANYRYLLFSCDQAALQMVLSVCPSVCPSVRPSVCLSHLFDYVPIIVSSWNFQNLLPMTKVRSMQKVKVRGQRSRSQRSQPNLTVSGL